jgi:hypothetical protein
MAYCIKDGIKLLGEQNCSFSQLKQPYAYVLAVL